MYGTQYSNVLIQKIESIADLSSEEKLALVTLPMHVVEVAADQDIVREGDRPSQCCVVLEGFVYSYKIVADGRRQIASLYVAGDLPDLQSLHLEVMDNGIGTMTPCKLAFISHNALRSLCEKNHRITNALWRASLIDAAIAREWVANLGQRNAQSRLAHLFCEMIVRLGVVGLVDNLACELPLTQSEFGDAMGLSTVHVNRCLQELRGAGLISLSNNRLQVLDWDGLKRIGDFDPTFLHLKDPKAASPSLLPS
jgi:CRP-like cAMP-binding protein